MGLVVNMNNHLHTDDRKVLSNAALSVLDKKKQKNNQTFLLFWTKTKVLAVDDRR